MARLGSRSKRILGTCCPELQAIMKKAITYFDFKVISGQRGEDEQNELHERGLSTKVFPLSTHNTEPLSDGVDIAPYPIDWSDELRFARMAGVIDTVAQQLGFVIRWGGDWDRDTRSNDQTFMDLGHVEIVRSGS